MQEKNYHRNKKIPHTVTVTYVVVFFCKNVSVIVCHDLGQCDAPTWVLPKRDRKRQIFSKIDLNPNSLLNAHRLKCLAIIFLGHK
jgi:hypothetical protein